jgi:uncharacterized membrane protein
LHTENHIEIKAPADVIYGVAARVEDWPRLLSHYRYVHVLDGPSCFDGLPVERTVAMGARRSGMPVAWTAVQTCDPATRVIRYRHIGGITTGMEVEWLMDGSAPPPTCQETSEVASAATMVRIVHELRQPRGPLRIPLAAWMAGELFIKHIADRTLHGIKRSSEAMIAAPPAAR